VCCSVSPGFCIKYWRLAQSLGVFLLKLLEEAGLDDIRAIPVNPEGLQAVPKCLGRASEDAGELLDLTASIPCGNLGSSLNAIDQ